MGIKTTEKIIYLERLREWMLECDAEFFTDINGVLDIGFNDAENVNYVSFRKKHIDYEDIDNKIKELEKW